MKEQWIMKWQLQHSVKNLRGPHVYRVERGHKLDKCQKGVFWVIWGVGFTVSAAVEAVLAAAAAAEAPDVPVDFSEP